MEKFDALREIEWTVALISFINGIYLLSPLYNYSQSVNGKTVFATALGDSVFTDIFGVLLLIGGIIIMYGIVKDYPRLRAMGLFLHVLTRFYNISLTIVVAGFIPITWLSSFAIMVIALILWIEQRKRVNAKY